MVFGVVVGAGYALSSKLIGGGSWVDAAGSGVMFGVIAAIVALVVEWRARRRRGKAAAGGG